MTIVKEEEKEVIGISSFIILVPICFALLCNYERVL
jgi:hypothetical protein